MTIFEGNASLFDFFYNGQVYCCWIVEYFFEMSFEYFSIFRVFCGYLAPPICKVFWVVVTVVRVKAFYYLECNIPCSFQIIFEVLALTSHCKKALPYCFAFLFTFCRLARVIFNSRLPTSCVITTKKQDLHVFNLRLSFKNNFCLNLNINTQ